MNAGPPDLPGVRTSGDPPTSVAAPGVAAEVPARPPGPLRVLGSRVLWASLGYLLGYLFVGTALFCVVVPVVAFAGGMSVTLLGLPLLVAAAVLVRGCADVERGRLRMLIPGPVPSPYRPVSEPGVLGQLRGRWSDRATWRDLAYLVALYPPLMVVDGVVLALWLGFAGDVALPLWFWAVPERFDDGSTAHGISYGYFPHGPHGPDGWGVFIGDLPTALAVAAVSLVLLILTSYLVALTARTQARMVRALLRPAADPLGEARRILAGPGPLPTAPASSRSELAGR